jgi:hypothetical protein
VSREVEKRRLFSDTITHIETSNIQMLDCSSVYESRRQSSVEKIFKDKYLPLKMFDF